MNFKCHFSPQLFIFFDAANQLKNCFKIKKKKIVRKCSQIVTNPCEITGKFFKKIALKFYRNKSGAKLHEKTQQKIS